MSTKISIAASVIILLIGVGFLFFFSGRPAMQIGSVIITLIIIAAVWIVKGMKLGRKSKKAVRIDSDSKALLDYIHGKFNERGIKEICRQTHGLTAAMMLKMKSGEIDGEEQLLRTLRPVPRDKFEKVRDIKYLTATLTSYYLTAPETSETRFRINDFIRGDYKTE